MEFTVISQMYCPASDNLTDEKDRAKEVSFSKMDPSFFQRYLIMLELLIGPMKVHVRVYLSPTYTFVSSVDIQSLFPKQCEK